jgi:hypothetical protein
MTDQIKKAYRADNDPRITQAFVRDVLDYDPDTGEFRWRLRTPNEHYSEHACCVLNARDAGKVAGTPTHQNYLRLQLLGDKYLLHRVAYLWLEGEWPDGEVDHIDGDPTTNAWRNLRVVTKAQNRRNAARRNDNTSGVTGVWRLPNNGKWLAYIRFNTRLIRLGRYADFEAAVAARRAAEIRYGFHENHGSRKRMTLKGATLQAQA